MIEQSPFELETGKLYIDKNKKYFICAICGKSSYISIRFIPTDFVVNFLNIFARLVIARPIEDSILCTCAKEGIILIWLYDKRDLINNISEADLLKIIFLEQKKYLEIAVNSGFLGETFLEKVYKNIVKKE